MYSTYKGQILQDQKTQFKEKYEYRKKEGRKEKMKVRPNPKQERQLVKK
jgi:hypothetical protein